MSECSICDAPISAAAVHGHRLDMARSRGRPKGVTPCSVDGCERGRASREGYCSPHAARWRKFGSLEPRRRPAAHGTASMYGYHRCRCAECVAANRVRHGRFSEQAAARLNEAPHGTASAYMNWGCRCEPCRQAGSINNRACAERRKQRKAAA